MPKILITGGTVVDTEPNPHVRPATDVLVEGDTIAAVGQRLPSDGAEVIDARDRLVLPGFVDTHRHTWQAVLRSIAPELGLGEYLERIVRGHGSRMRPEDVYTANLLGALECLDSGITTLLDWSHIQRSPEHTDAAVQALRDSGLRAVFGYCHPSPSERRPDELRRVRAEAGDLLSVALAAWGPAFATIEDTERDWRLARELDIRISVHVNGPGPVSRLSERGLLGPDTTYVHVNGVTDDEMRLIRDSGGSAAVSPDIEAQMGLGQPETGRLRRFGIPTSLSADTPTGVAGDMFTRMRAAFAFRRADALFGVADVLRMATLDGARAAGMVERVGSLRPGKLADIVLVRTDMLNIAPLREPVAAIVTAADVRNVDTVLVGGTVVKRAGHLVHADVAEVLRAAERSADRVVGGRTGL